MLRICAVLLAALQAILPIGVGIVYAQEIEREEGLFGYTIAVEVENSETVAVATNSPLEIYDRRHSVLRFGTAEEIKEYLGTRTREEREAALLSVSDCCTHIRDTLQLFDFIELLTSASDPVFTLLLPEDEVFTYIQSLSPQEKNTLFTELTDVRLQQVVQALTSEELHEVLLDISDQNQRKVLESMSQEELDQFVEDENDSGNTSLLLVGLGAAAALYLLSTASVPVAAAATTALTSAGTAATFYPYGGRALLTVPCTCTPGFFLVVVAPPRPGLIMYGPGTFLFSWYNIFPPAQQLGKALIAAPLPCLVYTGNACVPVGAGLYSVMAGTSLL
jgi:hypothetical protein